MFKCTKQEKFSRMTVNSRRFPQKNLHNGNMIAPAINMASRLVQQILIKNDGSRSLWHISNPHIFLTKYFGQRQVTLILNHLQLNTSRENSMKWTEIFYTIQAQVDHVYLI